MNILAAYDGSPYADRALARAVVLAGKFSASLTLFSATPDLCLPSVEFDPEDCARLAQAYSKEALEMLAKKADELAASGIAVKTVVETGDPVDKILETAESLGADLIVVGSRGMRGARRFLLGSVSSKVAEYAKCDVLIVK